MRLKTIRLHPFGRFLDDTTDVSRPHAVVAGPNDMGKSTLRQAIFHALFTASNLTPAKLRDTMEAWFPLPAGDHASITLTFVQDGKEWTLEKRWGVGKATRLFTAGAAPLADPQTVSAKLTEMLGHSEATFRHVLFTGHTELEQTIASLRQNTAQLRDIRDLLRAGDAAAGDVDQQRLTTVLNEKIEKWFGRWDDERGRPQRQNGQEKGVNDRWSRGVGEILAAWYAWQQIVVERDGLLGTEKEIDRCTLALSELEKSDQDDQTLISNYARLRGPLNDRRVLEQQVPRLEQEVKELRDAFREWPQAEATVKAWESTKAGMDVRIERLNQELASARKRETTAGVIKSYQSILAAQQAFNDANKKVDEHSCPDADTVGEIVGLERSIESGESKLNARTLAWRVEATELGMIRVTRGLGAAELIEVNTDGVQGTAAGRLQVELGGLRLTVDGGDDNVDAMIDELQQCRARLAQSLAACGVETVDAALKLAKFHAGLVDDARIKQKTFESLLQGRTFDEWEQEAASINSLPQTRDAQSIEKELREVERQRELEEGHAQVKEQTIEKWKAAYGDWDSLADRLPNKQAEFKKAKEKLDTAPSVPPGYVSAEHLINELDEAQTRLNENRQPRDDIKTELARLDGQLADRRSEELAEQAEVAERAFRRVLTTGQCLRRIRDTLNEVTVGSDDVLSDFAERIERLFSQVTRGEAKLEFDGAVPVHVHRGAIKLAPTQLSQGTSGALALAIRLAMAEAYLQHTGGFIMLDDPLVHFDGNRA
ncbi:MAG: AAA family ATPase, partial [Planctomycetaceae bacterium]